MKPLQRTIVGLSCFMLLAMQPATSHSWSWGEVSEDTKTSAIIDAGLNTGDGIREQIIKLADKRTTAGHMRQLMRGNIKYMKMGARRLSQCTAYFGKIAGTGVVRYGGVAFTAADGVASSLGHLSVGQYADAGTVFVTESAETVSALGGAAALGFASAKIGTLIGGIPGGLIGGAIGSVAGAALGGAGFTVFGSEEVGALAQYTLTANEVDPRVKTELARRDYFNKKQLERNKANYKANMIKLAEDQRQLQLDAEKSMAGIGWENSDETEAVIVKGTMSLPDDILDEKPVEIPKFRAAPGSRTQPPTPRLRSATSTLPVLPPKAVTTKPPEKKKASEPRSTPEERRKMRKDLMKKADRIAVQGGGPLQDGYGATPVIPMNGTIDIVTWVVDDPEHKTSLTWYLNSGNASSTFTHTQPQTVFENESTKTVNYEWTSNYESNGTLTGNIIHSTARGWASEPYRYTIESSYTRSSDGQTEYSFCDHRMTYDSESQEVLTLNIDGTLTFDVTIVETPTYTVTGTNCPTTSESYYKAWQDSGGSAPKQLQVIGIWQLRE